jgi:hypoxanthine-guanine phosphoribosyltransferase
VNTNIHWNKKISRKKPSILLVDDIIDEGITMQKVIYALKNKFKKIDIAVLFYKKVRTKIDFSKYKVYYYKSVGDEWVIFPWEIDK